MAQTRWMPFVACCVAGLSAISTAAAQRAPALTRWSLSAQPVTVVKDDGTPTTQFGRIAGAARLSDGGIAIADMSAREIRRFDASGRSMGLIARAGSGPGEVESVSQLSANGDTIAALAMRSAMLFTRDGRFIRRAGTTSTGLSAKGKASPSARLSDGRFLGRRSGFMAINPPSHLLVDSATVVAFDLDGQNQVVVGEWAVESMYAHFTQKGKFPTLIGRVPLRGAVLSAASGDVAWAANSATDSLVRVDRKSGRRVLRLSALGLPPVAVSAAEFQAARARAIADAPDEGKKELAQVLYDLPRPKTAPGVSKLVPGVGGELWLQRFTLDDTSLVVFVVVDAQGRPVAEVTLPARSDVYEVGRDYVVLGVKDADDVQTVALYGLKRTR